MSTILMTEACWRNSQLSIARFYGGINFNGHEYIIVNKDGKDLFQCSVEAKKAGRVNAIEPGEPADLIRKDFQPLYRKFGRDKFITLLKEHEEIENPKDLRKLYDYERIGNDKE